MWDDFELDPERIPTFKLIFHGLQILFAFIAWCLEIAVFRDDKSKIVGNNGWTFGVVFLSVPAWIYLMMAPRFPRTRKLAHPYAMLAVDATFTVIWLSAFSTQAAYNSSTYKEEDEVINLCGNACSMSKAIVGLGVFVFIFFCATTFLSIWTLKYYQWNHRLPGYDRAQLKDQNIDPDKAAFSLAPHDEEAYAPVNLSEHDQDDPHSGSHYGGAGGAAHSDYSDPYGPAAGSQVGGARSDYSDPYGPAAGSKVGAGSTVGSSYRDNPFRQQEANPFDNDTEYHSGRVSAAGSGYAKPTATDEFDDARFPQANYDRIERL
ncbi:hypothetical protein N658DRAFT_442440 [Parathielavia hyrcaniae]|uniref:MARVEL domain-containing protein n=1 Tax=Parathielavia hyrcaniae TaxID=113614 RepID=A0AAN6Q723_9PEZI|nr:hypothetical protein N658DRAFT_442440 [Parathielavia hyrcaniae]